MTFSQPLTAIKAILAAAVLVLGSAGTASAVDTIMPTATNNQDCNEGGVGGGVPCHTDNSDVYYYMDSNGDLRLEAGDQSIVRNMMADEFSPTVLRIHYDSSPVFSGSAETDLVYQEGAGMDSGTIGIYWCNDVSSYRFDCDQGYIRMRGAGVIDHGLACHETGHGVGLVHGNRAYPVQSQTATVMGCMRDPQPDGATLGSTNTTNINNLYSGSH